MSSYMTSAANANSHGLLNSIPRELYEIEKRNPNNRETNNTYDLSQRLERQYNVLSGTNSDGASMYAQIGRDSVRPNKYVNMNTGFNPADNRVGSLSEQERQNGNTLVQNLISRNSGPSGFGTSAGFHVPIRRTVEMDVGAQGIPGVMTSAQQTSAYVKNMEFIQNWANTKDGGINDVGGKTTTPYLTNFAIQGDYYNHVPANVVGEAKNQIRKTRKADKSTTLIADDANVNVLNKFHLENNSYIKDLHAMKTTYLNHKGKRVLNDDRAQHRAENIHANGMEVHAGRQFTYSNDKAAVGQRLMYKDTDKYRIQREHEDTRFIRTGELSKVAGRDIDAVYTGHSQFNNQNGRRVAGRVLNDRVLVDVNEGVRTGRVFGGSANGNGKNGDTGYQPIKSDGIKCDKEQFMDNTFNLSTHDRYIEDDRSVYDPNYALGWGDVHHLPQRAIQAKNVGSRPQDYSALDESHGADMSHNHKRAFRMGQDATIYEHKRNADNDFESPATYEASLRQQITTVAVDRGTDLMNLNHVNNISPEMMKMNMMKSLVNTL